MTDVQDRFPGLGTTIEGSIVASKAAADSLWQEIRTRTADFEQRFSRFRRSSELAHLNARAGHPVQVSQEMLAMLRVAKDMWNWTAGTVDPLVGGALVAAGYRQSFTSTDTSDGPAEPADVVFGDVAWTEDGTVTLPSGSMLDFGGIGKGYLADRLAEFIRNETEHFWISLGGDIAVSGRMADGRPWPIAVQDQRNLDADFTQLTLELPRYGIATSSTQARRGIEAGKPWHHIIDPTTNAPAQTDLLGVTVVAPTTLQADVAAKTVLIRKTETGQSWLATQAAFGAILFPANGEPFSTPSLNHLTLSA